MQQQRLTPRLDDEAPVHVGGEALFVADHSFESHLFSQNFGASQSQGEGLFTQGADVVERDASSTTENNVHNLSPRDQPDAAAEHNTQRLPALKVIKIDRC